MHIKIKFKRVTDKFNDIPLPSYATPGSACMDIRAAVEEPYVLQKGKVGMVPTNLSVEIPEGYEIQVRARSGLAAKHGIGIMNGPGTIDSDYRGEIKIILMNFGEEDFVINKGERIAQLALSKVYLGEIEETETLTDTVRGEGGFGHTGRN